jgi:hypothetical protein
MAARAAVVGVEVEVLALGAATRSSCQTLVGTCAAAAIVPTRLSTTAWRAAGVVVANLSFVAAQVPPVFYLVVLSARQIRRAADAAGAQVVTVAGATTTVIAAVGNLSAVPVEELAASTIILRTADASVDSDLATVPVGAYEMTARHCAKAATLVARAAIVVVLGLVLNLI